MTLAAPPPHDQQGGRLLDLRSLRDHWTVEGARAVFADLVTLCVRRTFPDAKAIRPAPGDDGIDTYTGELATGKLRVWQSKFFPDGVSDDQKEQIRDSFKTCTTKNSNIVSWTLCLPVDLSVDEQKWWQGWRKKQDLTKYDVGLWSRAEFLAHYSDPKLTNAFDLALKKSAPETTLETLIGALAVDVKPLVPLDDGAAYLDAVFVKKIEAAGVTQHAAARTAFYNAELVRNAIESGGDRSEVDALRDLLVRIEALWENEFLKQEPADLGKEFFIKMNDLVEQDSFKLRSVLPLQPRHRVGLLYYLADLCRAGWTQNYKSAAAEVGAKSE